MSTFNTPNIENASGGAPEFSQGLTVGGTAIGSLITMTEYYSQAGEPSSPANGAVWWDGTNAYQYMNDAWRILSLTPPPSPIGGRGLFAAGLFSNTVEYITIATPGNATDFGDLTQARNFLASCSNGNYGLFGGGTVFSDYNIIDYVTISTPGNATDFGDLTVARDLLSSCSDGVYGLFGGGYPGSSNTNTIDYVTIATTGNAIDFGDLTEARRALAACSDATYGVFGGGYTTTQVNSTEEFTAPAPFASNVTLTAS